MPFSRSILTDDSPRRRFLPVFSVLSLLLGFLVSFVLSFVFLSYFYLDSAFALMEPQSIHFSGDKQLWDRKTNQVELFGHAAVSQERETMTADYIHLDQNEWTLDARGNCVYLSGGTVIVGEEMHFNLNTRTGMVLNGRVSNERFSLQGSKINKLGEGHFQTHWGEYTTCRDCAPVWSIQAEDVDMEIDGYAYLTNVTTKIKDTPAFWLPYFIVPLKTRRQTGFLFPITSVSGANGAVLVFPFFWAINRSTDMTFGIGQYTQRGMRFEWEGRYSLSPRSGGQANARYQNDRTFHALPQRWSLDIAQTQELPGGIEEKLRLSTVSDNLYPYVFPGDVPGAGEAFLPSRLIFTGATSDISGYLALQTYRNLLNSTPGDSVEQQIGHDPRTVQAFPTLNVTTNERPLWSFSSISNDSNDSNPTVLMGGLSVGFTNFTRTGNAFDYDRESVPFGDPIPAHPQAFNPGVDPIRKATRLSVTPSVYTTLRPWNLFSVVPSLQYRSFFYNFGNLVPNLNRGYLLFQTELSTQLEKIYEFPDDPRVPRGKHLIRPLLTYSFIPPFTRQDQNHPFLQQINYALARGITGYNFDNYDIVPISYTRSSARYFVPLGNSLAYGFNSQWIRKLEGQGAGAPSYQNIFEFSAGQAANFLEISEPLDPGKPQVLTRFFATSSLNLETIQANATYYYYPDIPSSTPRHTLFTSATYVLERSLHQSILTFDRSISLGYSFNHVDTTTHNLVGNVSYSLSDYFTPSMSFSYGLEESKLYSANLGLAFQSPARCWKMTTGISYTPNIDGSYNFVWNFDLKLNIDGSGFTGMSGIANQMVSR